MQPHALARGTSMLRAIFLLMALSFASRARRALAEETLRLKIARKLPQLADCEARCLARAVLNAESMTWEQLGA